MTEAELDQLKKALEAKWAELVSPLRRRDEIAIEKSADIVDEMTCAVERDFAMRNIDLESNLVRNVRAALQHGRWYVRHLCALRHGNQLNTVEGCTLDALLHRMPGTH
jgi:RNA polymerase-binding transcription factor DksA